jgi:hypothetical protein
MRRILRLAILLSFLPCGLCAQAPTPPAGYNYDEAKVPPYVLLNPLQTLAGHMITTPAEWPARRAELLHMFEENVYGRTPAAALHLPLKFKVVERDASALNGLAVRRQVVVFLSSKGAAGPAMHLLLYLPAHRKAPSPVILGLNFQGNPAIANDPGILLTPVWQSGATKSAPPVSVTFPSGRRGARAAEWQAEMVLQRGYGLATVYYGDIDPDYKGAIDLGIRPYFFRAGQHAPENDDWGSLAAWAWGLSRAMDYLRTDPAIDKGEIAVTGHSRLGKAADWAAAQDQRFAALLSTESGKGGQSLYHREFGETIAHLDRSFPYWFCANFDQWVDRDREIPVDGNLLLALIAPRPLYVASAAQDLFSDPMGEFLSAVDAGHVYAMLGKQGLDITQMPRVNHPVMHDVAYHIRSGVHDVTAYDWEQYLTFLDLRFGSPLDRSAKDRTAARQGRQ